MQPENAAALIFRGGTVRTLDPARPLAEALAVDAQGRIAALGEAKAVEGLAGDSTHYVDLKGGVLLASFKDHHLHLLNIGLSLLNARQNHRLYLDLSDARSLEEVAQMVRQRAQGLPSGSWILGKGWSQSAWGSQQLPSHHPLSRAAPQHPVFLTRVDGHAGWVNSAALKAAGIDASTPDPPGGAILRDDSGAPSGVLLERANQAVTKLLPPFSAQDVRSAFRLAAEELAARGLTQVYEAGFLAPPGIVALEADLEFYLQQLRSEDAASPLPLRIHLMIPAPSRLAESVLAEPQILRSFSPRLRITHLKLFADGAMGSRGADLSHPFHDDPSTQGVPRMSADEIRGLAERALQAGLDVATHAIGDASVGRALDVYEQLLEKDPSLRPARLRIEHFSYASQPDLQRAARLGVVLSVQPAFVAPGQDGKTMEELRVGAENSSRIYAWGSLHRLGARLAGGSDDFTQPGPALIHFYSALTRSNRQGHPAGGWQPGQRLSRLDSLQLLTRLWPAGGDAPVQGLQIGAPADLMVLSGDPISAAESEILNIQVHSTWLGGEQSFGEVQTPRPKVQGRAEGAGNQDSENGKRAMGGFLGSRLQVPASGFQVSGFRVRNPESGIGSLKPETRRREPATSASLPPGSQPPASSLPPVERFVLPNGLTVLVQPEPRLPLAQVATMYRAGSANEAPGITGMAHYVEHMCFRATENVSKADITGFIDRIGGRWNGYTSLDQTYYAATVPSWALEEVLGIEAERMSRALFDGGDFERERSSVIAELQSYENDPLFSLWNLALSASFEIHPYRYNIVGWLDDLLQLTRDEAFSFYKRHYGPNNAVLAVAGDVRPQQVLEMAQRQFGAIAALGQPPEVRVREPLQAGEKRVRLRHPSGQQGLLHIYRAPAVGDPDFPALLLLDALLAGGRSLLSFPGPEAALPASRLQRIVQEAGGIEASTALTPTRFPYVYGIGARAGPDAAMGHIEARLEAELKRIQQQGVSQQELAQARLRLRTANALESRLADTAHRLAYYETMGGWELADRIQQEVDQVGSQDIQALVRKWLQPQRRTVALLVPGDAPATQAAKAEAAAPPADLPRAPSPPPALALKPAAAPAIARARTALKNGVRLAAARRQGKISTLHLRFKLGSSLDPPGKPGMGRLALRLLTGDSQWQQRLQAQGVHWSSQASDAPSCTSREYFDLTFRFLDERRAAVLQHISQLFKPRPLAPAQVERQLLELRSESAQRDRNDPIWRARREALSGIDPGWFVAVGAANPITAQDVQTYLKERLQGGAVTAAWVGPMDPDRMLQELRPLLDPLPSGKGGELPPGPKSAGQRKAQLTQVAMPGKTQVQLAAAIPALGRDHPDALSLSLLNYILGETGYAGRLGDALVDTGLAYSVYAQVEPGRLPCPWLIETAASPQDAPKALKAILSVLRRLQAQGVSEADLRQAQAFRLGRLTYDLDSDQSLARSLVEGEYYGEDPLDLPARSASILAVTHQQLSQAARRHCRPQALSATMAGAAVHQP